MFNSTTIGGGLGHTPPRLLAWGLCVYEFSLLGKNEAPHYTIDAGDLSHSVDTFAAIKLSVNPLPSARVAVHLFAQGGTPNVWPGAGIQVIPAPAVNLISAINLMPSHHAVNPSPDVQTHIMSNK